MTFQLFTVVGARPQFVKAAAVSRVVAERDGISERIVHTGQHYDANMSDIFFEELGIPAPARHLGIGGGRHGQMTGAMLTALEDAMLEDKPDAVLVYGDTNSTLAAALAASKLHIPIVHVEAGLRSFNRRMPEEINRVLTDHLSALLLAPTQAAMVNLEREGLREGAHLVGDVMYDATLYATEAAKDKSTILADLGLEGQDYAICTIHRAENTDDVESLGRVIAFLEAEGKKRKIIFPIHPRTRQIIDRNGMSIDGVELIDPVGYFDLHLLLANSSLVLTDSGGLQKEAYFHKKPTITLRSETEWTETVEAGWNRLWTSEDWVSPRTEITDYGIGSASGKIVDLILDKL